MSAKNNDRKQRFRSITIGFRVSPEEAYRVDMEVNIIVRPNIRVRYYLERYLIDLTAELKRLSSIPQTSDVLENLTYLVKLISKLTPDETEKDYE